MRVLEGGETVEVYVTAGMISSYTLKFLIVHLRDSVISFCCSVHISPAFSYVLEIFMIYTSNILIMPPELLKLILRSSIIECQDGQPIDAFLGKG